MKNKILASITALCAALVLVGGFSVTAYAQTPTEETDDSGVIVETEPQPLTPEGNKTLSFSKIEGRHGTYALIDKGENRDREIRKPRPSIRAQLKADKAKTAPKKAAAKTKNHDMEV